MDAGLSVLQPKVPATRKSLALRPAGGQTPLPEPAWPEPRPTAPVSAAVTIFVKTRGSFGIFGHGDEMCCYDLIFFQLLRGFQASHSLD